MHSGGRPGAGPEPDDRQPLFLYDLASVECYLAAERVVEVLGVVPDWVPVLGADLPRAVTPGGGFRCAVEEEVFRCELERRAAEQGLQALRWPPGWPTDSRLAMSVATYAKQIGRGVAFSLAAFRQAFAAGRDLAHPDSVVIAAAACEMHPAAVLKAADLGGVRRGLAAAGAAAAELGVRELPAVVVGGRAFEGRSAPEAAAGAMRAAVEATAS